MDKKTDYLVLINGENRMPLGFEDTVARISVENTDGTKFQVEKKTYEAFLRLRKDLLDNHGLQAELISAYRSVATQETLFAQRLAEFGEEYTYKYVAVPGHSEHHTGLAIDVSFVVDGNFPTALLVCELVPNALDGKKWMYIPSIAGDCCEDTDAVEKFDETFPKKEKKWMPSQEEFYIYSHSSVVR